MRVTLANNLYKSSFTARKKEIRDADDIQRKAVNTFPMFSPSYLESFYNIPQKWTRDSKYDKCMNYAQRLVYRINAERDIERDSDDCLYPIFEPHFVQTLKRIKSSKIGNCHEASIVTLSALAANGITDAKRCELNLRIDFVNKQSKETLFSYKTDFDHVFTMTAFNKKNPTKNDYVVLDSWFGFCDSISGAKSKYHQIVDLNAYRDILRDEFSLFRVKHFEETGEFIQRQNYEPRLRFEFKEVDDLNPDYLKYLGNCVKNKYPELALI